MSSIILSVVLFLFSMPQLNAEDPFAVLEEPLEAGQAQIIHLFHSGWLVRTQNKVLIFDYSLPRLPPGARQRNELWHIDPEKLKDFDVVVFTSHSHSDHFNPVILSWREKIPNITYVFGWPYTEEAGFICCPFKRNSFEIDGMKVNTVVSDWDGIPESAFLIKLDGITLYHAGDSSPDNNKPPFSDNLRYLHSLAPDIDIAFTPTWGGEDLMINALKPHFTFPMHDGGSEHQYTKFKEKAQRLGYPTKVIAAQRNGNVFIYDNGEIQPYDTSGK